MYVCQMDGALGKNVMEQCVGIIKDKTWNIGNNMMKFFKITKTTFRKGNKKVS